MKVTINLPYIEHVGRFVARVATAPVEAVGKAHEHLEDEMTAKAVEHLLASEKGQALIGRAVAQGLQNANLKELME